MRDWADDDDDDDCYYRNDTPVVTSPPQTRADFTEEEDIVRHPAQFVLHPSTLGKKLYDVEGKLLTDKEDHAVNVWDTRLKEMLSCKAVRCIHVPGRPGYRYFIRSEAQQKDFLQARETGYTTHCHSRFHLYPDEPGLVLPCEQRRKKSPLDEQD